MYYEISTIVRFNCRLTVSGKGPPPQLGTSVSCRDNNLIHYLTMQMFLTPGCSLVSLAGNYTVAVDHYIILPLSSMVCSAKDMIHTTPLLQYPPPEF